MEPIRPLKKPHALPVLQYVEGKSLTKSADELLLNYAKLMSEGDIFSRSDGGNSYFGSTFVTIDLQRADIDLGSDENMPHVLLEAVEHAVFFRLRLMRLARLEVERRCIPHLIAEMFVQTEFRIDANQLFVDINVECPLAMPKNATLSSEEGS